MTFELPAGDPLATIQTFNFPASFTELKSVNWSQQGSSNIMQVDNIVVISAPEPSSALMLLLGLVGVTLHRSAVRK